MDVPEVASSIQGVVDVATRTLSHLRILIDNWHSVPREVYELRDRIANFRQLLECALQSGRHLVGTGKSGHEPTVDGLKHELTSARSTLSQLASLLGTMRVPLTLGHENAAGSNNMLAQASRLKTKWSMKRDEAAMLHVKVVASHQGILGKLASLNATTSIDEQKFRHLEGMKVLSSMSPGPAIARDPAIDAQIQKRNVHNEQRFRHLEGVFSTMEMQIQGQNAHNEQRLGHLEGVLPSGSSSQESNNITVVSRPMAPRVTGISTYNCDFSCRCRCHLNSDVKVANWHLSAFKSTLGSLAFIFTGRRGTRKPCSIPSCVARHDSTWYRATYTFPSWLFHAAVSAKFTNSNGNPELLLRVLRRVDSEHYTSMFMCVARGDLRTIETALRRGEGSILDVAADRGISLLAAAFAWRRFDIVELLLREGADMFQTDDHGVAPFYAAIRLIYTGNQLPISFKSNIWNILPLDDMIEHCALTALHKVVMGIRCIDLREYLLLHSSDHDVNAGDINGQTPLFYASARGDATAVQTLIDVDAHVDGVPTSWSKSSLGQRSFGPLEIACRHGHFDVVEILVNAGADVKAKTSMGRTPLNHVCIGQRPQETQPARNRTRIVAKLLEHGADINTDNDDEFKISALEDACLNGGCAVLVRFLLERGADPHYRDWEGTTPLGNAIAHNALGCVVALLEHDESVCRFVDDNGLDLLHYLGLCASAEMMQLFIDLHGRFRFEVDATRQDNSGQTALQLCHGRKDATDQLKETFARLLEEVSWINAVAEGDSDSDSDSDNSSEFFDALEG